MRQLAGPLLGLLLGTAGAAPLPEPLGLADALALADYGMPLLARHQAAVNEREARLALVESESGFQAGLQGRARAVEPSSAAPTNEWNDSSARLYVRKRLYDAGYSDARRSAAGSAVTWATLRHLDARQQQQLAIMRAFFDVILADREFARDNEALAIAFIQADRAADNHELKRLSDVELLRLQSEYQEVRTRRAVSEARQRRARSRLAIAMGRPQDLVAEVVPPPAPDTSGEQPAYEDLLQQALEASLPLRALRAAVEQARAELDAARASEGVVISAEAEAGWYQRPTGSSHPLAAGLLLEMPFDTHGGKQAAIAVARAGLDSARAELALAEQELRQDVLELWQTLDAKRIELQEIAVLADYRELYLDRSRALYDLEVRTDLGDAMTQISAVRLRLGEAQYDWMMARARLDALTGRMQTGETK